MRIVVVGAGIAGVSAAYHLAAVHGARDVVLVEADTPLSMTSDKSTEAYRNWWPGPDTGMTAYMNDSIDRLEAFARATSNRFNMNRRGYVFASADAGKRDDLIAMARTAEAHGGGPVRIHDGVAAGYDPSPDALFDAPLSGVDVLVGRAAVARHFPYLAQETVLAAHARRAGWLSAQQLGMALLEGAQAAGIQRVKGEAVGLEMVGGRVGGVAIVTAAGARETLAATHVVLAAGAMMPILAPKLGLSLPIVAERHLKISIADTLGAVPRTAPMLIWLDAQTLPWSDDERTMLAENAATRWLTEEFPWGAHGRPDGGGSAATVLMLYNYHSTPTDVVFPLPEEEHYAEITLRGLSTMVPALAGHVARGTRAYVDGGYYIKTQENRPLIGPTPIEGVFVSCAFSGFGIMAAMAGGDLVARHVLGEALPAFAPAFELSRYDDPAYRALLSRFGDGGQL